eukprot:gene15804-17397_t
MLFGEAVLPALSYPFLIYSSLTHGAYQNSYVCSWTGFMTFTGGLNSIFHLLLMSSERYLTIVYPFRNFSIFEPSFLKYVLVTCWLLSVCVSSLPLFGLSAYIYDAVGVSCSVNIYPTSNAALSYNVLILLLGYVVPMLGIVFCNWRFLKELYRITNGRRSQKLTNRRTLSENRVQEKDRAMERQLSLYIIACIACFNIAWLPYAAVFVVALFGGSLSGPVLEVVPGLFAKSYSIYDPILYVFFNKNFRSELMKMFRKRKQLETPRALFNQNKRPPVVNETAM